MVTPFGEVIPAGKPSQFSFSRFHAAIDWQIKFFAWDSKTDPRSQTEAYKALIAGPALKEVHKNELNYASGGAFEVGLPSNQFITVADGEVNIAPGNYVLNVVTDDGCRVWLDGKLIISDAWKYQGPTPYSANVALGGKHRIHVEHFEIDGYSALKVDLKPRN